MDLFGLDGHVNRAAIKGGILAPLIEVMSNARPSNIPELSMEIVGNLKKRMMWPFSGRVGKSGRTCGRGCACTENNEGRMCTAKGVTGWLPVTASALATIPVFKMHGITMRIVLFVCTLLWLVNNALSLSIGGTVLEAIIAAVNLWTIIRMVIKKRSTDETPQEATASLV